MRLLKPLGLALVVSLLGLVTATTASAFTLPDIATALTGETYPIIGEGSVKVAEGSESEDYFETETSKIPDRETRVKLEVSELGSGGVGEVELLGIHESGKPTETCNTEGDAAGVVLVKGEFHLVVTSLSPLEIGTLLTFKKFTVNCKGGLKVKVEGPLIGRVKVPLGGGAGDVASVLLAFHCSGPGIQELSSYYNDEEKLVTGELLKANFGAGAENGCKELTREVGGNITSSSLAKMFTILY
jgi:hypothetical protein